MIDFEEPNLLKRIQSTLEDYIWKVRKFFKRLKKIYDYIPLLWEDEDWDHDYLTKMLRYKLTRMAKCIKDNNYVEANNRIAKQINYAVFLIDRFDNNDEIFFSDPRYIALKEQYGDLKFGGFRGLSPSKITTLEEYEDYNKGMSVLYKEYAAREEDTLDRLFKHMRKYFRHWWD